jgi:hypothetical protein
MTTREMTPTRTYELTRNAYRMCFQRGEESAAQWANRLTELGGKGWKVHTVLDRPDGLGALLEQSFTEQLEHDGF